ncbi:Heme exporter protein D (CcmD) [Legionella geestiana]|uniref:Heme exporter protein D n=1 Tax=Legionella geestiana TaxID=45065 RepID=A0A0W0UA76_9GAMM|nr:heme exporter protein CcmD [Legionella geestiana]KTD04852.1 Heme exporter protein D (CcmD) [Legionella geestiana]QBS11321.1 heme exporter protein CcmD [Legionella geestiana]QDQ41015.1 heme exporter protein CcmD [Legionella geestiana]STX54040.1 cytochrome c-type biogenesis protein CcmD [Legionella geestiana]
MISHIATKLAMGGYGAFVWPAFGLAALVVTGLTLTATTHARLMRKRLADWHRG